MFTPTNDRVPSLPIPPDAPCREEPSSGALSQIPPFLFFPILLFSRGKRILWNFLSLSSLLSFPFSFSEFMFLIYKYILGFFFSGRTTKKWWCPPATEDVVIVPFNTGQEKERGLTERSIPFTLKTKHVWSSVLEFISSPYSNGLGNQTHTHTHVKRDRAVPPIVSHVEGRGREMIIFTST